MITDEGSAREWSLSVVDSDFSESSFRKSPMTIGVPIAGYACPQPAHWSERDRS